MGQCLDLCHFLTAGRYEQMRNHSTPLALFAIGTSKSSNIALLGHSFRTATLCLHLGPYVSHTLHIHTLEENRWFVHDCSLLFMIALALHLTSLAWVLKRMIRMRTTVVQWPFLLFGLPDSSHSSFESLAPVCTFCLHTVPICLTHV